jgi:hypothetical protein
MKIFIINEKEYRIIFIYNKYSLNLFIKNIESEIENKNQFEAIKVEFKNSFIKYFENFHDLIEKIKKKELLVKLKEIPNENVESIKYLYLNIINNNIN